MNSRLQTVEVKRVYSTLQSVGKDGKERCSLLGASFYNLSTLNRRKVERNMGDQQLEFTLRISLTAVADCYYSAKLALS